MFQFPDKSMFTSLTAWGVFLYAVGREAEKVSFLPAGLTDAVGAVATSLSPLLVGLGVRGLAGGLIEAIRTRPSA